MIKEEVLELLHDAAVFYGKLPGDLTVREISNFRNGTSQRVRHLEKQFHNKANDLRGLECNGFIDGPFDKEEFKAIFKESLHNTFDKVIRNEKH